MTRTRLIMRLEPRDGTDLGGALAAGTWDPLWMLARQDALGELLGTFGGAPVACAARGTIRSLTHFRPGVPPAGWPEPADGSTVDLTATSPPLAVLAETQPVRTTPTWTIRSRATAGLRLADELLAEGVPDAIATLAAAYPIPEPAGDAAEGALQRMLHRRVPDGAELYRELAEPARGAPSAWPLPARLAPLNAVAAEVRAAARRWVEWCDATIEEPRTTPSWVPSQLAHQFAIAAATTDPAVGTEVLDATDPREELDWHAFDVAARGPHLTTGSQPEVFGTPALVPSALRFPGMPTARCWEMDDAAIDLGSVDASDADLARLLVLEYALTYGNDMFAIPLRVRVDTLTTVEGLIVLDTFGVRTEIPPAVETVTPSWAAWRMFTLADRSRSSPHARPSLLLLARLTSPVVADPVDDGQLVRDEMANSAWLIESLYEGEDGFPIRRGDAAVSDVSPPPPAPPDAQLRWTLAVTPPEHWVPYSPQADSDGMVTLLRAPGHPLRGRLSDAVPASLPDRLVVREGVRILRQFTPARDAAGRPYVWARWRRQVGRGETSSGLAFDAVRPHDAS